MPVFKKKYIPNDRDKVEQANALEIAQKFNKLSKEELHHRSRKLFSSWTKYKHSLKPPET